MGRGKQSLGVFVLLVTAISAMLSLSVIPAVQADENLPPYIYYYDNIHNGLIIERADGSDSRLVTEGIFPKETSEPELWGLSWSPSGQWVAWHSGPRQNSDYIQQDRGWLVSTDGKIRHPLSDLYNFYDVMLTRWSPVEDVLMVLDRELEPSMFRVMLLNPETAEIIAETSITTDSSVWYLSLSAAWLPDGSGVSIRYYLNEDTVIATMDTSGQVSTRTYGPNSLKELQYGRAIRTIDINPDPEKWDDALVMEDIFSGKFVVLGEATATYDTPDEREFVVSWDDADSHALIKGCVVAACDTPQLYLLDWQNETVFQMGAVSFHYEGLEDVDYTYEYSSAWSEDSQYLVYRAESGQLAVLNLDTLKSRELEDVDVQSRFYWMSGSTAYILAQEGSPILRYDAAANTLEDTGVTVKDTYGTGLTLSPDGRYLAQLSQMKPYAMFDLQTGQAATWIPHSAASDMTTGWLENVLWSDDSAWFISAVDLLSAGGGDSEDGWTIHSVDGTVKREISVCNGCVGYLPERAIPYLTSGSATPILPQPIMTLPHQYDVRGLSWSPDGTRIASYTGELSVWDVTGAEPVLLLTVDPEGYCGDFPMPCRMFWSKDGTQITLNTGETSETWDVVEGVLLETGIPEKTAESAQAMIDVEPYDYGFSGWSKDGLTPFVQDKDDRIYWLVDGELHSLEEEYTDYMDYRAGSPVMIGGYVYGRVKLWDAATETRLTDINWYANDVALSPDGTRIAAGGTMAVTIWNIADVMPAND